MAANRPDLNLLQVFDTIYREGSLTRAAKTLHLTQPALSHSLARLRAWFNDPLFSRQGNRMVPTPLATRFVETMRPGLNQIHSAVAQFHSFDPTHQRKTFSLALRDILESTFLPQLMAQLAPYPDLDIVSQRVARREMESQLAAGKLDFAIDVLLPVSEHTGHQWLHQDPLVVLARKDHPWVTMAPTGTSDELSTERYLEAYLQAQHVLVSSRATGSGVEDFELSRLGLQRDIRLRCQHYFAACRVVANTELLLTMPASYARLLASHHDLAVMPTPAPLPPVNVHLYWHKAYEQEPALVWFRHKLICDQP
ncbi:MULTISPECIES: LysR family transcriptional regulator [unclassified Marinobacter]|uniref:LysR family transcriptional regulator n=1 Tax=unclassified Marinobacter TaxID=83889 RepID=UPI00200BF87E|nr:MULTISPECIES: LysR family transcriptional regulator [unclassified Marinobacter]MCL1479465.1 LysR family transcriptional regulator [Marinobacter sp.]MCL1482140.1 LysR family transcriptional regulator [Marinobacter sp.]MCL1483169.1 LysR family transcriptional regulator [Marinobacter sp.]MCL1488549.1 LysR family transcriptional regulator [Marinobacter sp.]UQG54606.1 LysR family transcriptional regulator [Marinobacter sp. M4C]